MTRLSFMSLSVFFVHPKFDSPKDSKATEHGGSFLDFASVVVHLGVKGTHS